MLYQWLKIIHVLSACVLFGVGIATAFYMFKVNRQSDLALIASATRQVVFADWLFTGSAGLLQAITGVSMLLLKGYSLSLFWVWGSILGYAIAGACWLPVVWLQIRCAQLARNARQTNSPLSHRYQRYFRIWWLLGIPAFLALIAVFYLMTNKPP